MIAGKIHAVIGLTAASVFLAAVSYAPAAQEKPADTALYSWAFKYKMGDALRFRIRLKLMDMITDGEHLTVASTAVNKQVVEGVTETGDATLVETTESRKRMINGKLQEENPDAYTTTRRVFSKTGLLRDYGVVNSKQPPDKLMQLGAMLIAFPAPPKAVKVGETWKTEMDNRLLEGKKVTVTSTLLGKEKISGIDALAVKIEMQIPTSADAKEDDPVKMAGMYHVDAKAGRLLQAIYATDNIELQVGQGASLHVKTVARINLLVPGFQDSDALEETPKKEAEKPTDAGK